MRFSLTRTLRLTLVHLLIGLIGATATARGFDASLYFSPVLPSSATTITLEPRSAKRTDRVIVFCTVEPGDTLAGIAARFATTSHEIKLKNSLKKDLLTPGLTLQVPLNLKQAAPPTRAPRLPPGAVWHTVRRGETLSEIYNRFGISQSDLVNANPEIRSLDQIHPGERFVIPSGQDGAYIRLKPGQQLLEVAAEHDVELGDLLLANNVRDLNSVTAGDYLVLPGVDARAVAQRLQERRNAEAAIRSQVLYDLAKERKVQARRTQVVQAAQNSARSRLRSAQVTQTARVRRASANFSFPSYGGGYMWPMRGVITSGYGTRGFWIGSSNFHTGVDIASGYGTPIYAAHSGVVEQAGYGFFGLNVWVGVGGGVENIYGHMSRIAVYAGSYVQRGQLIGYEGCSGICTGPHLHFEVRVGGQHVNPLRYLP